jgi:hypothetical protein
MNRWKKHLALEALESRQVLSATVGLADGDMAAAVSDAAGQLLKPYATRCVMEQEANDTRDLANGFELGRYARLVGSLHGTKDIDYFAFKAVRDGMLTVTVPPSPTGTSLLQLEDAAGAVLYQSDYRDSFTGGGSTGTVSIAAGETYFVKVSGGLAGLTDYAVDLKTDRSLNPGGGVRVGTFVGETASGLDSLRERATPLAFAAQPTTTGLLPLECLPAGGTSELRGMAISSAAVDAALQPQDLSLDLASFP